MAGETGADREGGQLIDRVPARPPIREFVFIQPVGHARIPFPGVRADHRAGIDPAATRMVQRKRRPTSKVDSMIVLPTRRGRSQQV